LNNIDPQKEPITETTKTVEDIALAVTDEGINNNTFGINR
jgi:hypothetical protein